MLLPLELVPLFDRFPIYSTKGTPTKEKKALAVFRAPWNGAAWIVLEAERDEGSYMCMGQSNADGTWGKRYFTIRQLEEMRGPHGERVELDRHIRPLTKTVYALTD